MKHLHLLLPSLITLSATSAAQLHKDNGLDKEIGRVLAVGDFNGDGYKDQAIGVPDAIAQAATDVTAQGFFERAGAVHVTYGSKNGLGTWLNQYWHQDSPGIPGINEDGDEFGAALAAGDFDGDGYHDLAIGSPGEAIGSIQEAGAVVILYGSWLGLRSTGAHSYHQDKPGFSDHCEAGDRLGASLAAGDFDGNGFDDLAVGAPNESSNGIQGAGMVHILYGLDIGLLPYDSTFTQDSPGVPNDCDADDTFGYQLATGNLNGDIYDDLVVTVPGEDGAGFISQAGMAHLFRGSSDGLEATTKTLGQKMFWLAELNDAYVDYHDEFGRTVACGDFDGDGVDDVVIGSPGENTGSIAKPLAGLKVGTGAINVFLMEPSSSFSTRADLFLTQDSAFVPGTCELFDLWGSSLCVGDLDGDGADDIIVGAGHEDIGSVEEAGMATVLYGGSGFLYDIRALHQDTPGVPGVCEGFDLFSAGLSAGDFDGDGRAELSVGVPGEVIGSATNQSGYVQVFEVSASRAITWKKDLMEQ